MRLFFWLIKINIIEAVRRLLALSVNGVLF